MKVWALVNWFDEEPAVLADMVKSLAGLCHGVIALDGRYPLFPAPHDRSHRNQYHAITETAKRHGMVSHVAWTAPIPEVEKRTLLFNMAERYAEPMVDWYLIMDADQYVDQCPEPAVVHQELAATRMHTAEVGVIDVPSYARSNPQTPAVPIRFLMRAMPGLKVWGRHSYYVAEVAGRVVFPWNAPHGYWPDPALDLVKHVTLHHCPFDRLQVRDGWRHGYYDQRATANIEFDPGEWAESDPPWLQTE